MKKKEYKIALILALLGFLVYLGIQIWPSAESLFKNTLSALTPVFVGAILAYIFNLPMVFFEKKWFPKSGKKFVLVTRRPICLILSVLSVFAVVGLVVGLVVPQLISCIRLILEKLPVVMDAAIDLMNRYHLLSGEVLKYLDGVDWKGLTGNLLSTLSSGVGGVVDVVINTVTEVISGVITAVLSFIFSLYFLICKDKLKSQFIRLSHNYLPEKVWKKGEYFFGILNTSFQNFIVGQCTEAVILGCLCAIGMMILQLPYAAMVSAFIAFTALIPIVGAYIGAGVSAVMILTVSPIKALIFLVFILILQQIEGNLIYPKVVGSSLRLPGVWVLVAITVGGGVAGVSGMLLGVPLAATLYRVLSDDVKKRENAASATEDAPEEEMAE